MSTQYVWVFVDPKTEMALFTWDGRVAGYRSRSLARDAKRHGEVDASARLVKVPADAV